MKIQARAPATYIAAASATSERGNRSSIRGRSRLARRQRYQGRLNSATKRVIYQASEEVCGACPLKSHCTAARKRRVYRSFYAPAVQRLQQRTTAETMRLRRSVAEHPFATLKFHIFGHPRFLLRGLAGARTEIALATMVYNLKRMMQVLGCRLLQREFVSA